jgi:nitroimidazol reductase NimA-like FMN-containing flavoprotein (pyridoxamine 5'-phosphate oxidase superfamily)
MRRKDKAIADPEAVREVLRQARFLELAMVDDGEPYLVTVCFGFDGEALFFHSAPAGRKVEVLARAPRVCFQAVAQAEVLTGEKPCDWSVRYRSVVGYGRVARLTAEEERRRALDRILAQYGAAGPQAYAEAPLKGTAVFRIDIESMTGKTSKI